MLFCEWEAACDSAFFAFWAAGMLIAAWAAVASAIVAFEKLAAAQLLPALLAPAGFAAHGATCVYLYVAQMRLAPARYRPWHLGVHLAYAGATLTWLTTIALEPQRMPAQLRAVGHLAQIALAALQGGMLAALAARIIAYHEENRPS